MQYKHDTFSPLMIISKPFRCQDQGKGKQRGQFGPQILLWCNGRTENYVYHCCHAICSIMFRTNLLEISMIYSRNKNLKDNTSRNRRYWLYTPAGAFTGRNTDNKGSRNPRYAKRWRHALCILGRSTYRPQIYSVCMGIWWRITFFKNVF